MASVVSQPQELLEPARKRQKLSPPSPHSAHAANDTLINSISEAQTMAHNAMMSQRDREVQAGILCFVNESNPGFSGILKQRYTDFLVNEVTLDGKVVHLTDTDVPRRKSVNKPSHRSPPLAAESIVEEGELVVAPAETVVLPEVPPNPPEDVSRVVSRGPLADSEPTNGFTLSADDTALLDSYFGTKVRTAVVKLYEKVLRNPLSKPGSLGFVFSEPITDRQLRGRLHQDMRRIFNSRFETVTNADGVVTVTVAQKNKPQGRFGQGGNGRDNGRNQQTKGRLGWQELGGEHLHFSLYKENKDTMEVISYISSQLKTSSRQFNFAGTKDRRGVTVQRVSVYRVYAETLASLNRTLRGSKVGNFQYEKHRLELGDLMGNEFLITLRDCTFVGSDTVEGEEKVALADKVIGTAVKNMQVHGFINYYGLQRFGTYAVSTDDVGKKILQGDFEGAVNAILTYGEDALACALDPNFVPADGKPLPRDDIARAEALYIFKTTDETQAALDKLPRKFSGEISIIRYMNHNRRDFVGALLQIPRNLRLMYVHAYQSLVWNMAASERWIRYGDKIVKGDLVLVDSESAKYIESVKDNEVDESGEIIVLPAAGDAAVSHDDLFERARPLTAEEAASGKYNIFDIVLPTPGYDIEYPCNNIGEYYKEFMMSERGGGLDPSNMRRAQQDFSLSGSYRKLLGRIGYDMSYEIKLYRDDNEQMVETDLEKITKSRVNFGARDQGNRSRGACENDGNRRARQSHWDSAALESNALQRNAWKNLPAKLAEDEKVEVAAFEAQKTTEVDLLKAEAPQPTYKETFIQTSAEHGKRTGHRETTVMPGVYVAATEASTNSEATADSVRGIKVDPDVEASNQSKIDSEQKNTKEAHENLATVERAVSDEKGQNAEDRALYQERLEKKIEVMGAVPYGPDDAGKNAKPEPEIKEGEKKDTANGAPDNSPKKDANDEEAKEPREKIAVIVKFQLGSSQYATMALRELMKQGGVQTFKPEFSSGR